MTLSELLTGFPVAKQVGDAPIEQIQYDSRAITPGALFVAISGYDFDGHQFVADAQARGAVAIITERWIDTDLPQALVEDTRAALSHVAAEFYGRPADQLRIIGITGTKGKTSTTNILYQMAEAAGQKTGVIGTNGIRYGEHQEYSSHTTPVSLTMQRVLREMLDAGVDTVFMEASSNGLKLKHLADVPFDIAGFTNFSPDHIGPKEHPDLAEYLSCKSLLFDQAEIALINGDDPQHEAMLGKAQIDYIYGLQGDFRAEQIVYGRHLKEPTCFHYVGRQAFEIELASPGEFSVYNALLVIAIAELLDYPIAAIQSSLAHEFVTGRAELLPSPEGTQVVLDYAHNGLSLRSMLETLRIYQPKRLLVLMGSVGGRTPHRRKELGDVAAELADVAILTSDNPDFEDPDQIIADIAQSFVGTAVEIHREADRKRAVELALSLLQPGDILLLAGKGHEEYQLIRGVEEPHSDYQVVLDYWKKQS